MATQHDMAVLRTLVQQGHLDRDQAVKCLDHIDAQAKQGRPLGAAQAARELGLAGTSEPETEVYVALRGEGLAGFELGPVLGEERLGTFYKGRRTSDGQPTRVLTLHPGFESRVQLLQAIQADLQDWVGFHNPLVAETLAVGRAHQRTVVVFAEAPGDTLEVCLQRTSGGRLPEDLVKPLIRDLADALDAVHSRKRGLGDVRPGTVCFDGHRARLVRPGLARAAAIAGGFARFGVAFGHPAYLAPEIMQVVEPQPTPAADVYALGVLTYELITGQPPFRGEWLQVLEQHFESPLPPPPRAVAPGPGLAGLILKMTAKAPSRRPSAREVANALREAAPSPAPAGVLGQADWGLVSHESGHDQVQKGWTPERIAAVEGPTDLEDSVRGRNDDYTIDVEDTDEAGGGEVAVGDRLGRGPLGFAYDGVVPGQSEPVVIKVVSRKFRKKPELQERILGALREATKLRDEQVVATLDVRRVGDRDLVIQEKARARPLRALLSERRRLPAEEALELALGVARGLRAAARVGISHGDIRPEKVYVDPSGAARLADFGQAEASCLGAGHGKYGVRLGHPSYLAPEVVQERRRQPDFRSDVYALGITLYEVLCGQLPFRSDSTRDLLVAHLQAPLPPPPGSVALPRALAEVLFVMTSKAPAKRYGDPQQLIDALERCRGDLGAAARPAPSASASDAFYLSDEVQLDDWGQESLLLSQPDGEWDKSRITHGSGPGIQVEEWSPELSGESGRLYDMMSSQEVMTSSRDEILAELGVDAAQAAAGYKAEQQKAISTCKLCSKPLSPSDLDYGRICMACRTAGEVSVRDEADAGERKHRALSKVVRVEDDRRIRLRTAGFALFLMTGITGLLWTIGLSPPVAVSLGSLAAFLGALAYYRALT